MNDIKRPFVKVSTNTKMDSKKRMTNKMKKSAEISEKIRKAGNKLYGQKNHNKELHKDILWTYSKSIAYAPEKSEQLAAAYSNRSVLLMHIGRNKESIADIDRALKISQSEELLLKLVSRRAKIVNSNEDLMKSLTLSDDKHQSTEKKDINEALGLPRIIKPSVMMPCASDAVLLKCNEIFGRHLIAARDIKPGEIIVDEEGYICIPKNNLRYILCSHCLLFTWNGIPCDDCPFVMYCSEDCKKEAWKEYHDVECLILPYLDFIQSERNGCVMADIAIALRLFIKAVNKEGLDAVLEESEIVHTVGDETRLLSNGIIQNNKFRACYNLTDNVKYDQETHEQIDYTTKQLINLFLLKTKILDSKKNSENSVTITFVEQLMTILRKIRHITDVNSFYYQGSLCNCPNLDELQCNCGSNRGAIIAPCSSLINHSCCSNVSRLFLPKKRIILFTLTHVKKGEQLCDSYGPSIRLEKKDRQEMLQKNFHFTCMCQACTENWPHQDKLKLLINVRTESNILCQVIYDLKKKYPKESELFIFQDPEEVWGISKVGLDKAILTCELISKYSNNYMKTYLLSIPFRFYIDKVFFTLYQEKFAIPDTCS